MNELAPVVLFVYKRLDHTIETVNALRDNFLAKNSHLYIFSDAPKSKRDKKDVDKIREYIYTITGFEKITVIERVDNMGLANSIIDGVSHIIDKHGKIIVVEDDLVTSRYFLTFLNDSLDSHAKNKGIMSVAGYSFSIKIPEIYAFDVYSFYRCMSWGWATWKDRWENVDWSNAVIAESLNDTKFRNDFIRGGEDLLPMLTQQLNGKVNSWAIRWCLHHYKTNSVCLYPVKSCVRNIGFDGSGVHCGVDPTYNLALLEEVKINVKFDNQLNEIIVSEIQKIHRSKSLQVKVFNRLRNYSFKIAPRKWLK